MYLISRIWQKFAKAAKISTFKVANFIKEKLPPEGVNTRVIVKKISLENPRTVRRSLENFLCLVYSTLKGLNEFWLVIIILLNNIQWKAS